MCHQNTENTNIESRAHTRVQNISYFVCETTTFGCLVDTLKFNAQQ